MADSRRTNLFGRANIESEHFRIEAEAVESSEVNQLQLTTDMPGAMTEGPGYILEGDYQEHPRVRRTAALLVATMMTAEEWRIDASRKLGRGVLRVIAAGTLDFRSAFTGKAPAFPMPRKGGRTGGTRELMFGERKATREETIVSEEMSPLQDPGKY